MQKQKSRVLTRRDVDCSGPHWFTTHRHSVVSAAGVHATNTSHGEFFSPLQRRCCRKLQTRVREAGRHGRTDKPSVPTNITQVKASPGKSSGNRSPWARGPQSQAKPNRAEAQVRELASWAHGHTAWSLRASTKQPPTQANLSFTAQSAVAAEVCISQLIRSERGLEIGS